MPRSSAGNNAKVSVGNITHYMKRDLEFQKNNSAYLSKDLRSTQKENSILKYGRLMEDFSDLPYRPEKNG